jgi:hypothetical protein
MCAAPAVGLCALCVHVRVVVSGKGSRFYLCKRSEVDPRFAKYPRLPVLECIGFEKGDGEEPGLRNPA